MSDPFVGEIRIFGFNFPPRGWAFCDGQLMPISQNTALFSLLGTYYGGDGRSTFALPNLQGQAALQPGQGTGLSLRDVGESGGESSVALLTSEMPAHSHSAQGSTQGDQTSPQGNFWGTAHVGRQTDNRYAASKGSGALMNIQALALAGGGLPHNNMHPYLVLNFCIALQGIFPPRS